MHRFWSIQGSACAVLSITSVLAFGCGGDSPAGDPSGPLPPAPSTLTATTPASLSDTAASTLTVGVEVRDGAGAVMSGVNVAFTVISGGGSASPATVSTGADGRASTAWRLGTGTGPQLLRAAVTGLNPLSFTAEATPGAPAVVMKRSGDGQQGFAGHPLEQTLSVEVRDAYGNRVSSVPVSFAVISGGGAILGPAAIADGNGVATSGEWTLGFGGTTQSVSASAGGANVVFTASADPCQPGSLTVGAPVSGSLQTGDCLVAGAPTDKYLLTTSTQSALTVTFSSTAFAPGLLLSRVNGTPIASDLFIGNQTIDYCAFTTPPDGCHTPTTSSPGSPLLLLAAPGTRVVTATSADQQGGAYTLSVQPGADLVSGCRRVFIERGVSTAQSLRETDCKISYGGTPLYYSDDLMIFLKAGTSLQVTVASSAFTPWIEFYTPTGSYHGGCADAGATSCSLQASVDGYYLITASSFEEHATGGYTLTVN